MKLTGPEAVPPPCSSSFDVPVEDGRHVVLHGEDETGARLLRDTLHTDVEPHRRVEGCLLLDNEVLQLVAEDGGFGGVEEVAVLRAPRRDRVDDTVDDRRSEVSRSGVPSVPRKYFWARMFVAFMLHVAGTSTPSCSKATAPVR
jgi:hypothetical protein